MMALNAQKSVRIHPSIGGESPADSDGSNNSGRLNTGSSSNKFGRTGHYRRRSKDFSNNFGDTVSQRYRGAVLNSSLLSQASQASNSSANPNGTASNESAAGLENLINYLTTNVDNIKSSRSYQKEFEEMVHSLLQVSHDPELLRVMKTHGWMGHRFRNSDDTPLDPQLLLQALSNLYLKHQVSHYGAHISSLLGAGESKSADQIISFVPDSLIKFLKDNIALLERSGVSIVPDDSTVPLSEAVPLSETPSLQERQLTGMLKGLSYSSVPSIDTPTGGHLKAKSEAGACTAAGEVNAAAASSKSSADADNNEVTLGKLENQSSHASIASVHSFQAPNDEQQPVESVINSSMPRTPPRDDDLSKKLTFVGSDIFNSSSNSHSHSYSQSDRANSPAPGDAALAAVSSKSAVNRNHSLASLDSDFDITEFGQRVHVPDTPLPVSTSAVQKFTFTGACMLADISGFSKFSGAKCSEGVSGLDDLREATNGFLGHIVKIVYDFEGDVIAFAGDALICVFLDKPEPEEQEEEDDGIFPAGSRPKSVNACYRALQCACVLRSHKTKYLSAHIGVSYGEMSIALLGGYNNQWVYLMNGHCVSELAGCIEDAGSEQVAATPKCLELALQSPAVVEPNEDEDDHSLPPQQMGMIQKFKGSIDLHKEDSESDEEDGQKSKGPIKSIQFPNSENMHIKAVRPLFKNALLQPMLKRKLSRGLSRRSSVSRSGKHQTTAVRQVDLGGTQQAQQALIESTIRFVPRPILTAVYSETLEHIGELRVVTTMFVSLDSYSPEKHCDPTTLQPFFVNAQKILQESGGYLRQFLIDDKGCVFIAMWGMPSFTYANNSSRALFCGVSINRMVEELDHKVSIGITTGNVFCGTVGAPERSDFAGIGTDVNMAARLMSKAKGRVLIDVRTYESLNEKTRCMLSCAEKMKLKGSDTPVVPYQYSAEGIPTIEAADDAPGMKAVLRRQVKAVLGIQIDRISNSKGNINRGAEKRTAHFTIITGPPGTGKSTAVEYFRHSARKRNLPCIFIQARPGHEGVPYGLMRELFLELVGEDNFKTEMQQRQQINNLVNLAYMEATDEERLQAMFSLELVLGVEWSIGRSSLDSTKLRNLQNNLTVDVKQKDSSIKAQAAAVAAAAGAAAAAAALVDENEDNSSKRNAKKAKSPTAWSSNRSPTHEKSTTPTGGGSVLAFLGRANSKKIDVEPSEGDASEQDKEMDKRISSGDKIKPSTGAFVEEQLIDSKQDDKTIDAADASAEDAAAVTNLFLRDVPSENTDGNSSEGRDEINSKLKRNLTHQLDAIVNARAASEGGPAIGSNTESIRALEKSHAHQHAMTEPNLPIVGSPMKSDDGKEATGFNFLDSGYTMSRPAGDQSFYRVLSVLINESTAIIIEDAQFCDELSWNEFLLMLSGSAMKLSVLVTVRSTMPTVPNGPTVVSSQASNKETSGANNQPGQFVSNSSVSNLNSFTPPTKHLSPNNSTLDIQTPSSGIGGRRTSILHTAINDSSLPPGANSPARSADAEMAEAGRGVKFQNSPAYLSIVAHENTSVIEMTGLNEAEVKELLLHALKVQTVSKDLVKLVAEVSSGNAFWCKEIANFIKEKGVQQLEKTIQQGETPHSALKVLILMRMEKLDLDQQVVLKHASVIGDEFSDRMLSAILPGRLEADCVDLLESLTEEGFVFCLVEGTESIYGFQNQLIRDTLYELIPPRDSAALHLQLAEYIEETYARNLRPFYPMLGMHYTKSIGKRAQAFKFKVKAADQAISRGAFTDGLMFVEAAVALAVTRPELRVLLDVINRALRDLNASGSTKGQMSIGRRISRSFNVGNPWDQANNRIAAYVQLKINVESAVEKLTVKSPDKKSDLPADARKNGFKTQHSAQLNWQPSYVASKMSDNSEADDDLSDSGQQCCSIQ